MINSLTPRVGEPSGWNVVGAADFDGNGIRLCLSRRPVPSVATQSLTLEDSRDDEATPWESRGRAVYR
jgi:hypothetical protein